MDATTVICKPCTLATAGAAVLQNGLLARNGRPPVLVICGTQLNRSATVVYGGKPAKTYTFPRTATIAGKCAFSNMKKLQSVRLCKGLKTLRSYCFAGTGIRRLVFPSGIRNIESGVFLHCESLRHVDLRAAQGLK